MKKLTDILADKRAAGVLVSTDESAAPGLQELAVAHGMMPFLIDGTTVDSKEQFLTVMAEALSFPDYFGMNWDAFEDCLTDMSAHEDAGGYLIVYDGIQTFAEEDPENFDTAVEILKDAASFWTDQGKRMIVVLCGLELSEWGLPEINLC